MHEHLHQAQMTLLAFKGTEKRHIYDRQDIRDDLLTQFNKAVAEQTSGDQVSRTPPPDRRLLRPEARAGGCAFVALHAQLRAGPVVVHEAGPVLGQDLLCDVPAFGLARPGRHDQALQDPEPRIPYAKLFQSTAQ